MKPNKYNYMMFTMEIFNSFNKPSPLQKKDIVDFLYEHLDQFGDEKKHIQNAIEYAVKEIPSFGGFVLTAIHKKQIIGSVVVNQTGMQGYIPENILVYIAMHKKFRGKGHGKELMNEAIKLADGNIALHVEPDNPAKFLYEKIGFTNKYLEMRYINK
jgi:[ribosomal protein S18]-alanine N-acetyltransferase